MYELIKKDGLAKRGRLHTVHGVIETPVLQRQSKVLLQPQIFRR